MPSPFKAKSLSQHARGLANGYRSGLEEKIAAALKAVGIDVGYETLTIPYTKPEKVHRYTADWVLQNGILIESKGRFVSEDRKKHKFIREQHPHLDIRFVFSNPNTKIGKKSETTYSLWCERLGIPYATRSIPQAWIDEPPHRARIKAVQDGLG